MRLQSFVEILYHDSGVRDRHNEEHNREDGECREGPARRVVFSPLVREVHAEQLKAEVGESAKVDELQHVSVQFMQLNGCIMGE